MNLELTWLRRSSTIEAPAGARPAGTGRRSLGLLWALVAIELPFVVVASNPLIGDDVWWLLATGRAMAEQGRLLTHDVFTLTPLTPQHVNAQWLAEVLFFATHAAGGPALLILLNATAALATFGLVFLAAWQRAGSIRLAALASLLAFGLAASNLGSRAQTLAFPLFALVALALQRAPRRRRWLLAVPPATALWTNLHGSFPLAPLLVGCALLGVSLHLWRQPTPRAAGLARDLAATLLGSGLATLANPYGPGALRYVLDVSTHPVVRSLMSEWRPPTLNEPLGQGLFASFALVMAVLYFSRRPLAADDAALLLSFGALAIQAQRNVVWWALAAAPVVAGYAASVPWIERAGEQLRRLDQRSGPAPDHLTWVAGGLVLAALVLALPWVKHVNPLLPEDKRALVGVNLPSGAIDFLREQPPGNVYNYQGWGGYALWELWPRHRVYGDGRIEIHPPAVWADYLKIQLGHAEWEALLERYGVDYLLLHPDNQDQLVAAAAKSPRWRVLYRDDRAVVFGRREVTR